MCECALGESVRDVCICARGDLVSAICECAQGASINTICVCAPGGSVCRGVHAHKVSRCVACVYVPKVRRD